MDRPEVTRKLAAVMAADVAGYSRLMGMDEEGTLSAMNALACRHCRTMHSSASRPDLQESWRWLSGRVRKRSGNRTLRLGNSRVR